MNIAITDDLKYDRDTLKELLLNFFNKNKIAIQLYEYSSAEELLENFTPGFFDLLFLDIYMENISGIDAAKRIYEIDKRCKIIFLTTANCFAAESYDVKAVYYMIKPIVQDKLYSILENCMQEFFLEHKKLCIVSKQIPVQIPFSGILYADVASRTVKIHLADRTIDADRGFYAVAGPLLEDKRFIECYKGIAVNMDHIQKQIEDDFILDNNEKIPISKRKKKEIIRLFMEYEFEKW